MSEAFWSIDSLVIKQGVVFGFGWIFHPDADVRAVAVGCDVPDDSSSMVHAEFGKPRADVAAAFPEHRNACNSGFLIFGALPSQAAQRAMCLEVVLSNGRRLRFPIPVSSVVRVDAPGESRGAVLGQSWLLTKRALQLLRSGQMASLFEKAGRYLRGRPTRAMRQPSELDALLRDEPDPKVHLIVDHDLGGGANHYRDQTVESLISQGTTVLIFTFHVATLSHMLIVRSARLNARVSLSGKEFLVKALAHVDVGEIIYNTGVSFTRPEDLPPIILQIHQEKKARLKVLVHDYFSVCPSHFLLNHEGVFCRVPDQSTCAQCLPRNHQGFATLFSSKDIALWRAAWGALLSRADEIVVFSNSSVEILHSAYPHLKQHNVSVVPHVAKEFPFPVPVVTNTARLHIGVVGQIGQHKGAAVVQALAQHIASQKLEIKISIVGALEAPCDPSVVSQTGPYRREDLARHIEMAEINVMFFPSICPETFSYVVQELMYMQLPIACFDFGAPAERVSQYFKGALLHAQDPAYILDALRILHQNIYLKSRTHG